MRRINKDSVAGATMSAKTTAEFIARMVELGLEIDRQAVLEILLEMCREELEEHFAEEFETARLDALAQDHYDLDIASGER